jgi:ABC-type transport system involved in cytochrome c biogenesis permease subunit
MTAACSISLGLSLILYFAAAVLSLGRLLFQTHRWELWSRRLLTAGWAVHAAGMGLHLAFCGHSPRATMLELVSLLVLALLGLALLTERFLGARHVPQAAAPVAFLALLYAVLIPVRFDGAEHVLLRYPWLGVHVGFSLLGYLGFAVACCSAVAYLAQNRALKRGHLNRYLPALGTSASITYRFAAIGFWLFTMGLAMGVVWLYGAPGAYLGPRDVKILMAVPIWAVFAMYVYQHAVARRHSSRLKWLVIVGSLLALANLLAVRHQFQPPVLAPPQQHSLLEGASRARIFVAGPVYLLPEEVG